MNKTSVAQLAESKSSLTPVQGLLQRKCACGNHTPGGGECAECALKKKSLQRKLTIGASNDPLEHEADRVADQVMSTPLNPAVNATPPRIQRFSGQASEGSNAAPASVDRVLSSSGRPLEPTLQQDMGQRFGHDFSQVRVHTGGAAEQSARDVNAHAYTVGNNVVFGAGRFAPGSQEGQRLLAHELVHVVQQSDTGLKNVDQDNRQHSSSSSKTTTNRLSMKAIQRVAPAAAAVGIGALAAKCIITAIISVLFDLAIQSGMHMWKRGQWNLKEMNIDYCSIILSAALGCIGGVVAAKWLEPWLNSALGEVLGGIAGPLLGRILLFIFNKLAIGIPRWVIKKLLHLGCISPEQAEALAPNISKEQIASAEDTSNESATKA